MNDFWNSDTYKIVRWIKATGNRRGIIALFKAELEQWAQSGVGPDAEAVKAWLPAWQDRPYYTAAELAPIFPVLAVALGLRIIPAPAKSAALLANELRMAGLPHFERDGKTYFVVEQCHRAEEFSHG